MRRFAAIALATLLALASMSEARAQTPAPVPAQTGDPAAFGAWLNSTRARYGLGPVAHDPNLSAWAHHNNIAQTTRGLGHWVMGPARRQNAAMSHYFSVVPGLWMASPGHAAALLDPTITRYGISGFGQWWTFNAH